MQGDGEESKVLFAARALLVCYCADSNRRAVDVTHTSVAGCDQRVVAAVCLIFLSCILRVRIQRFHYYCLQFLQLLSAYFATSNTAVRPTMAMQ